MPQSQRGGGGGSGGGGGGDDGGGGGGGGGGEYVRCIIDSVELADVPPAGSRNFRAAGGKSTESGVTRVLTVTLRTITDGRSGHILLKTSVITL